MSMAETAAMPVNKLVPRESGFGLETTAQLVPFHCSIMASVSDGGGPGPPPAAHASLGDSTVTRPVETIVGAGTALQLVPSKCSFVVPPTAHTSLLASAAMPETPTPVKAGLETMLQLVPSQCSTKALEEPLAVPTAQASFDETAVTP